MTFAEALVIPFGVIMRDERPDRSAQMSLAVPRPLPLQMCANETNDPPHWRGKASARAGARGCGKLSHLPLRLSGDGRRAESDPESRCMRRLAFLLLVHALAGCSSGPDDTSTGTGPLTFVAQPLMTVTSGSGQLQIDVRTAPQQPPSRGVQAVQLVILDAKTLTPETGLSLAVLPWMPAMGHGASLTPRVQEGPPGTYVISNVDFFMAGTWEVRTNISGDATTDYAAPSFQIP